MAWENFIIEPNSGYHVPYPSLKEPDMAFDGRKTLRENFLAHPTEAGSGYIIHAVRAVSYGVETIVYGLMFIFHAVFPFWCTTAGSDGIKKMADAFKAKDEQTEDKGLQGSQ